MNNFTPATAVAATKAILLAVPTLGQVHDYRRTVRTQADITAFLYAEGLGVISAAFISTGRIKTSRDFGNPSAAGVLTEVGVDVELFMGLQDADASEVAFRAMVFAVLQAVNTRGLIDSEASHQEPMNADRIGYVAYAGDVLLHYATLSFSLRGRTSPAA